MIIGKPKKKINIELNDTETKRVRWIELYDTKKGEIDRIYDVIMTSLELYRSKELDRAINQRKEKKKPKKKKGKPRGRPPKKVSLEGGLPKKIEDNPDLQRLGIVKKKVNGK